MLKQMYVTVLANGNGQVVEPAQNIAAKVAQASANIQPKRNSPSTTRGTRSQKTPGPGRGKIQDPGVIDMVTGAIKGASKPYIYETDDGVLRESNQPKGFNPYDPINAGKVIIDKIYQPPDMIDSIIGSAKDFVGGLFGDDDDVGLDIDVGDTLGVVSAVAGVAGIAAGAAGGPAAGIAVAKGISASAGLAANLFD